MNRRRILVTGASGYLGSRLCAHLERSAQVIRWTRSTGPALDDFDDISRALDRLRPDHVVHAAGRTFGNDNLLWHDNALVTRVLANAVTAVCPDAILTVFGSAAEYGVPVGGHMLSENDACNPVSAYGLSKLAATRLVLTLVEERGLRANVIRPFNLIGVPLSPAQVLGAFVAKAREVRHLAPQRRQITMGRLDSVRDFFVVDDLVHLIDVLVSQNTYGILTNACSGVPRRVRELIFFLNELSGGRFAILESGEPPESESIVIGDPTRFLTLSGRASPTPLEPVLTEAWRQAMGD
ncbi:MAG: NAD-dependent epimerase/dehydratase family protein [Ensifer adhaerens]